MIERTEIDNWQEENGSLQVVLPIQNLLTQNETYLLDLTVSTAEKEIHYYTRIMWLIPTMQEICWIWQKISPEKV